MHIERAVLGDATSGQSSLLSVICVSSNSFFFSMRFATDAGWAAARRGEGIIAVNNSGVNDDEEKEIAADIEQLSTLSFARTNKTTLSVQRQQQTPAPLVKHTSTVAALSSSRTTTVVSATAMSNVQHDEPPPSCSSMFFYLLFIYYFFVLSNAFDS